MRVAVNRRSNARRHARRSSAWTRLVASIASSRLLQMNPVTPWSRISGTDPPRMATTGVPHASDSIITRPKGSGQSIGNSKAVAPPRKAPFSPSADLTEVLDERMVQQRLDVLLEVALVGRVHFGRDLEWTAAGLRDFDGSIDAFFRRDTAKEGKIPTWAGTEMQLTVRQTVIHGADPVLTGQRVALRVGDGDQRQIRELAVERHDLWQIEPAVQRRHMGNRQAPRDREVQRRDVKVDDVELVHALRNLFDEEQMQRERIDRLRQTQRSRHLCDQRRVGA